MNPTPARPLSSMNGPTDQPTGTPTDQPTGRPADWLTGRPADWPTGRPADQPTGTPADRPTGRPADRQTGRPADRQTGRPADQPTGRPADRQTPFQIGTAGWSYPDWEGVFYPSPTPRRFRALAYYSRFFNLVEVNATFYAVFPSSHAEKWCQEVAGRPDFTFSLKLWKGLTHESFSPLPRVEIQSIRDTCSVLSGHGRLGALLMQFPWSFRFSPANLDYMKRLLDAFDGLPRAVEIRHSGWHAEAFFDVLRERSAAFCNIDQPLLRDCPPPTSLSTAPFSYLRIHGRNAANWFRESATGGERYDYYYPPPEVEELARLAKALAGQTSRVMVTTNNHYRGQAAADALLLRAALEGNVDRIPPCLARAFPDVRALPARHTSEPEDALQPDFFDFRYEET